MSKGMYTCEVCGRDFALIAEERHTVHSPVGGFLFDAFDCPHCGCENLVNSRMVPGGCECCCDGCEEADDGE